MVGMTTTGDEEEEEGLNGTGREKSEGEEKEFEEEKEGKQATLTRRRLNQVSIPNLVFLHFSLKPLSLSAPLSSSCSSLLFSANEPV